MPKRSSNANQKLDGNQLAHRIARIAAGDDVEPVAAKRHRKNPAAVALGRKGGLKGGNARAAALTPERRKEISLRAAEARWQKKK